MQELLLLALAGAIGTLSRFGLGGLVYRLTGGAFPYGTLAVNLVGCFTIGLVMHLGLNSALLSRSARTMIAIGFLGAFTTFSSFSFETVKMLEGGLYWPAALNIGANLLLGLLATMGGIGVGRLIVGGA
jgi:fluoride exporter